MINNSNNNEQSNFNIALFNTIGFLNQSIHKKTTNIRYS